MAEPADEDIGSRRRWNPMHLQPVFARHRAFISRQSEQLFDHGVTLSSGSAPQDDETERVIKVRHSTRGESVVREGQESCSSPWEWRALHVAISARVDEPLTEPCYRATSGTPT